MLDLVGIDRWSFVLPDQILSRLIVSFVDARRANPFTENGRAAGAMDHVAEEAPATDHVPTLREQSGAVVKRVFDREMIEHLVGYPALLASALALCRDGPGILNPTADIEVMDQPIEDEASVKPGETGIVTDLMRNSLVSGVFGFSPTGPCSR